MEVRKKILKIFQDAKDDLCSFLPTDSGFLQTLVDEDVLRGSDKEKVEGIEDRKRQRREMIDILQEKDSKAYFRFMGILEEEQSDIYELLEKLEQKHKLTERTTAKQGGQGASKPDEPKKCKEPNPEPKADLKKIEDKQVSQTDVADIVEVILPNELPLVYTRLNLIGREVQRAEQGAATNDVKLKARAVFLFWIQTNGSGATRQKVLDALKINNYIGSLEELTGKWQK